MATVPQRRLKLRTTLACLLLAFFSAACADRAPSVEGRSPADERLRVELGRSLFSDTRLSADGTISCASCHDVAAGGDDGLATAIGIGGAVGPINTPTVFNSGLSFTQFWDGRAPTLEDQVHGSINNPIEMGGGWGPALARLSADDATVSRFKAVYHDGVTDANIADAIAAYERELLTLNSPFDSYQKGKKTAISAEAAEGYRLFQRLGCLSCHQGRAFGGNMYERFGVMDDYFKMRGTPVEKSDLGRYNVTGREQDKYKFKVPGLRNVALTAPYFHDGSAKTLEQAVRLMVRFQVGRPVTDEQVARLVAFLESLTGEVREDLR